ncbi:hypothetical protein F0562_024488 [Nyssa sinensis]|uniref:Uncharacterized protein n=1 Tax=Nyssa sinensis TaxID=561372 RepID=A0A5J5BBX1_9ASTE|nr:hypothetical protein F0562_024488 [Nyssa sinensis]
MKPHAPTADFVHVQDTTAPRPIEGEFVPVFVALGLILMSTTFGLYTATHQLMYAPNVRLRKSKRETLPELVEPDNVVDEADKFIKKSVFRKMAHIQAFEYHMVTDPFSDTFTMPPRAETLKSVGVV